MKEQTNTSNYDCMKIKENLKVINNRKYFQQSTEQKLQQFVLTVIQAYLMIFIYNKNVHRINYKNPFYNPLIIRIQCLYPELTTS